MFKQGIILLLCGLLTAFSLAGCDKTEGETKKKKYSRIMYQEQKRLIKRGNLTVEVVTPFSEEKPLVAPLEVTEEKHQVKHVIKWFFDHPRQVKEKKLYSGDLPKFVYYSSREPEKQLHFTPLSFRFSKSWEPNGIFASQEDPLALAEKFIVDYGGLPSEYQVQELQAINDYDSLPDTQRFYYDEDLLKGITRYYITLTPLSVDGIHFYQNGITINITPNGVTGYTRNWRAVKKVLVDRARPILSPQEALDKFNRWDIRRLTLVYYGEGWDRSQTELWPVWMAWIRVGGDELKVGTIDAYTGRLYDLSTNTRAGTPGIVWHTVSLIAAKAQKLCYWWF